MEQYRKISEYYDLLFEDWQKTNELLSKELDEFFRKQKKGIKKVLDCGCGTGIPAIGLAKLGYDVTGLDICPEMLKVTRRHAAKENIKLKILQADWRKIPEILMEKFDAVIYRGNSINHNLTQKDIETTLHNIYKILRKGGLCYIGMRDWSFILQKREHITLLTPKCRYANGKKIAIFYVWDFPDHRVIINVVFIIIENEGKMEKKVYPITILPITFSGLQETMEGVGFKNIKMVDIQSENIGEEQYSVLVGYK